MIISYLSNRQLFIEQSPRRRGTPATRNARRFLVSFNPHESTHLSVRRLQEMPLRSMLSCGHDYSRLALALCMIFPSRFFARIKKVGCETDPSFYVFSDRSALRQGNHEAITQIEKKIPEHLRYQDGPIPTVLTTHPHITLLHRLLANYKYDNHQQQSSFKQKYSKS